MPSREDGRPGGRRWPSGSRPGRGYPAPLPGRRRPSGSRQGGRVADPPPGPAVAGRGAHSQSVFAARIMQCLAKVSDIAEVWAPIGIHVEAARLALAGEHGLSESDLKRLECYSRRWSRLDSRLQRMFEANAQKSRCARIALWQLILAERPRHYGSGLSQCLEALWVDTHGYPASIELMPIRHIREGE
jgi:hypothetical protein